jgi:hypothetical protein
VTDSATSKPGLTAFRAEIFKGRSKNRRLLDSAKCVLLGDFRASDECNVPEFSELMSIVDGVVSIAVGLFAIDGRLIAIVRG